jgi:hypothetical protein
MMHDRTRIVRDVMQGGSQSVGRWQGVPISRAWQEILARIPDRGCGQETWPVPGDRYLAHAKR